MMISKLKVLGTAMLMIVLTLGGLQSFGVRLPEIRPANAAQEATPSKPGHEIASSPGAVAVDRLDFGELHEGAIAEAELNIRFTGRTDPGLSLKIDVPDFATVKQCRLGRRGEDQPER